MKKQMTRMYVNAACAAFLVIFACREGYAQVKIGNNPGTINADAVVEMETADKGMLLPRVALSATDNAAPLSAFTGGMTVYNTATAGSGATAVSPGIYYSDGVKWVRAQSQDLSIYGQDGTLGGDRTINLGGHDLKLGDLQPQDTAGGGATGTLVVDDNGTIRRQTANSVSAARIKGIVTLDINNVGRNLNYSSAPTVVFDNLREFSNADSARFTARKAGLYQVSYWVAGEESDDDYYLYSKMYVNDIENAGTATYIKAVSASPYGLTDAVSTLVKLNAGDKISFRVQTFRAADDTTPKDVLYDISITKLN